MKTTNREMTFERACELSGLNPKRPLADLGRAAQTMERHLAPGCPLRYSVALAVILKKAGLPITF